MKKFFSLQQFKDLKILFILEILMLFLISILIYVNKLNINFFDLKAFINEENF